MRFIPKIENLEGRELLANCVWSLASGIGNWSTASNWSDCDGGVPGPSDSALFRSYNGSVNTDNLGTTEVGFITFQFPYSGNFYLNNNFNVWNIALLNAGTIIPNQNGLSFNVEGTAYWNNMVMANTDKTGTFAAGELYIQNGTLDKITGFNIAATYKLDVSSPSLTLRNNAHIINGIEAVSFINDNFRIYRGDSSLQSAFKNYGSLTIKDDAEVISDIPWVQYENTSKTIIKSNQYTTGLMITHANTTSDNKSFLNERGNVYVGYDNGSLGIGYLDGFFDIVFHNGTLFTNTDKARIYAVGKELVINQNATFVVGSNPNSLDGVDVFGTLRINGALEMSGVGAEADYLSVTENMFLNVLTSKLKFTVTNPPVNLIDYLLMRVTDENGLINGDFATFDFGNLNFVRDADESKTYTLVRLQ